MVYRKGELSRATIDREWLHQVGELRAGHPRIYQFCADLRRAAWDSNPGSSYHHLCSSRIRASVDISCVGPTSPSAITK